MENDRILNRITRQTATLRRALWSSMAILAPNLPHVGSMSQSFPSAGAGHCGLRGAEHWQSTRASPLDSVSVRLGPATATICYRRPSAKGRKILDSLLEFGHAWRTGANEPTTLDLTDSAVVAGARLPAGRYVLLTIPDSTQWTIVFTRRQERIRRRCSPRSKPLA
jgi:hypothetical protein